MEAAHDSLEVIKHLQKTIRMLKQMRKELMSMKQQEELKKVLTEIIGDLKKSNSKELEEKLLNEKKKLDDILNKSKGKKLDVLISNSKQRTAKEVKQVKMAKKSMKI